MTLAKRNAEALERVRVFVRQMRRRYLAKSEGGENAAGARADSFYSVAYKDDQDEVTYAEARVSDLEVLHLEVTALRTQLERTAKALRHGSTSAERSAAMALVVDFFKEHGS